MFELDDKCLFFSAASVFKSLKLLHHVKEQAYGSILQRKGEGLEFSLTVPIIQMVSHEIA